MIIRKLEALFTLNTNALQFKKAASELDKLASHAETVMKAIAGYWAVQALQNFVANTASAMSEIGKMAGYLGVTSDALQELRYAAEKSGVSIDALDDALKELQVRAVDASTGQGEAAEAFDKLGLKGAVAAGRIREPLELLNAVADSLKTRQEDRLWLSDAIFGDEGAKVLLMLKDGSAGLKKLRQEAKDLGYVLRNESIDTAQRFSKALHRLRNASYGAAKNVGAEAFAPLATVSSGLANFIEQLNNFSISLASSQIIKTGFLGSLALAATKLARVLIPLWPKIQQFLLLGSRFALVGSGVGAALLLLQDVFSYFNGANSVIGELGAALDKLGQKVSDFAQIAWNATKNGFSEAFQSIKKEFANFSSWLMAGVSNLVEKTNDLIASLVPDFLKKNFSATIKQVSSPGNESNAQPFSSRMAPLPASRDSITETIKQGIGRSFDGITPDFLKNFSATIKQISSPSNESNVQAFNALMAPQPASVSNQNRFSSQQNINVAVNVKSQANPQEIGGEISKAVRQALERERFNAFMGVMNYAG